MIFNIIIKIFFMQGIWKLSKMIWENIIQLSINGLSLGLVAVILYLNEFYYIFNNSNFILLFSTLFFMLLKYEFSFQLGFNGMEINYFFFKNNILFFHTTNILLSMKKLPELFIKIFGKKNPFNYVEKHPIILVPVKSKGKNHIMWVNLTHSEKNADKVGELLNSNTGKLQNVYIYKKTKWYVPGKNDNKLVRDFNSLKKNKKLTEEINKNNKMKENINKIMDVKAKKKLGIGVELSTEDVSTIIDKISSSKVMD